MKKAIIVSTVIFFVTISLYLKTLQAHEGETHAPAPGTESAAGMASKVMLSDAAIHNLGILTEPAKIEELAESLDLNATVSFLPEKHAKISPRFDGKVKELYVQIGEKIAKGQKLLSVDPVAFGNPGVIIKSPIAGYIMRQDVVIGQFATRESVAMEIADPSQVLVTGKAFETPEIARLKVGQNVKVSTPSHPGQLFVGTVQRLDVALKTGSRTLDVYALVNNPTGKLLGNMQAILSVSITKPEPILAVPSRAILGDSGDMFLYVRNKNQFERRSLKLGKKYGPLHEIIEGVFPDEQIVVQGQYQLQFAKPAIKEIPEGAPKDDGHTH